MNNEQPIKRTYTVEEVATILGVSIRKAYDLAKRPKTLRLCVWVSAVCASIKIHLTSGSIFKVKINRTIFRHPKGCLFCYPNTGGDINASQRLHRHRSDDEV